MGRVPGKRQHNARCLAGLVSLLLFVVFQHFVAVVFNTRHHFAYKICGLRLKEPAQSDNAFSNSTQVVEQRRRSVRFPEVVYGIRSLLKLSHELRRGSFRLLRFCGNVNIGALSLESLKDRFGLLVPSAIV